MMDKVKMGFKRPFDEDLLELPLKHPKQVDCGNKLTSFSEIYPCYEPTQKDDIPVRDDGGMVCKFKVDNEVEHDSRNVVSELADKESEITTRKEDAGSGATVCSSLSPDFFEFYFPRRSMAQFEDPCSSALTGSPRIHVPIGPNHQTEVPEWDPLAAEKYFSGSDHFADACGRKLMGDSIFLMPDPELSAESGVSTGDGREDCFCPDQGSVRCVRQHVREAWERIRETLGPEKFVQLGFCDMGEEVSQNWTEEEERVFQMVVYSNPVSRGKNFWEHLSVVFPFRTKKEIVSYYFNVFMLRRRAVQNRSKFLDIDSDDDEWMGSDGCAFGVAQEDEDSAIDTLVDQDVHVDHEYDSPDNDDDKNNASHGDENKGGSDDCDGGDGDAGNGGGITTENDVERSLWTKPQIGMPLEDCRSGFVVHHVGKNLRSDEEKSDAQNVSSIRFEFPRNAVDSFGSACRRAVMQEGGGVKSDRKDGLHGNDDGSTDYLGPGYLLEPGDAKLWDARYPMSPLKGFDLLPAGNIIEEIFGSWNQNSKSCDEKHIS
ncbi:uncharacterized protein LOC130779913 isoform X1 [Actinidia eriantha]|uniref:uncharacterized protein LOC130779913 isoform X1 n=2 Tax=Actinidia eriantha TaxID=165200 RepID=UPI002590344C|nr:uncharacterized protein LOC130779913 isoform X1 [Actinidia eriantha]